MDILQTSSKIAIDYLLPLNENEARFYCCNYLSGDSNKKLRQAIMQELTGQKIPVAKCGMNAILDEIKKRKDNKNGNQKY